MAPIGPPSSSQHLPHKSARSHALSTISSPHVCAHKNKMQTYAWHVWKNQLEANLHRLCLKRLQPLGYNILTLLQRYNRGPPCWCGGFWCRGQEICVEPLITVTQIIIQVKQLLFDKKKINLSTDYGLLTKGQWHLKCLCGNICWCQAFNLAQRILIWTKLCYGSWKALISKNRVTWHPFRALSLLSVSTRIQHQRWLKSLMSAGKWIPTRIQHTRIIPTLTTPVWLVW